MKKNWIGKRGFTLLILAVLLSAGASFGAGTKFTLSVKDKSESETESTEDIKEDGHGNEHITIKDTDMEICTLTVKVKMRGEPSRDCQLEWAFISEYTKSADADEERVVFCTGKKNISLQENVELVETIVSDPFFYAVITSDKNNATDKISGDVYEGYVVLLTSNGEILASKANTSKYLKDEWIEKIRGGTSTDSGKKKKKKR
jgi:hypothetical protein